MTNLTLQKLLKKGNKNPENTILQKIASVLSGNINESKADFIKQISCSDLNNVPICSKGLVRRRTSIFSVQNCPRRQQTKINFDNLKYLLVIKCNSH